MKWTSPDLTATNTNGWSGGTSSVWHWPRRGPPRGGFQHEQRQRRASALHIFENRRTWTEVQVLSEDEQPVRRTHQPQRRCPRHVQRHLPEYVGPDGPPYIYRHDGTEFVLETQLDGESAGDNFGSSVALDGNTLVVGIPRSADAVPVQEALTCMSTTAMWEPRWRSRPADLAAWDNFGVAAAIEGNLIIVGPTAPTRTGPGDRGVYMGFARENGLERGLPHHQPRRRRPLWQVRHH